ncbi:HAMP domain-containing protein [Jiella endophytica]|uniref:histidine kinase n=1 Tax=Jiella endophytica TaxID=2558362 RepID=A0A4Y8RFS5_9HYPH|nr:histidine kinase [Jiella endophytica]TFF20678.1 HAMP domain-containing protein [Jiella endophytica]TFF26979.1 HAMP domain-containing protein [Jiella endophytica]
MSLKARLALTLTIAFVAILVIGAVLTFFQARDTIATELQAARSVATNRVAQMVAELPASRDVRGKLAGFVRTFNGDRRVKVILIDSVGVIRDESVMAKESGLLPEWFVKLLAPDPSTVVMPLTAASAPITSVAVIVDPRNELADAWLDLLIVLGLLVLFLLIAFGAVWVVADRALKPLDAIHASFSRIGDGDYSAKVAPEGPPEMRELAGGLNAMTERLAAISDRNRRLSDRLLHLEDEERAELARDLHDDVGPLLFAIDVDASSIRRAAADGSPRKEIIAERAGAIAAAAHEARRELKRILGNLRPGATSGLGLKGAIEEMVADLQPRHPDVEFDLTLADGEFGATIETLVHRAVREAVTNALRHGDPSRIAVEVAEHPGRLNFTIIDDGGGFTRPRGDGGFGLVGMGERIEAAGGTMIVEETKTPRGVRVSGAVPLGGRSLAEPPRREDRLGLDETAAANAMAAAKDGR